MEVDLREELAEYAHDAWARYMRYFFDQCQKYKWGTVAPRDYVRRLGQLIDLPYSELTQESADMDRAEADKMLAAVARRLLPIVAQLRSCGYACEGGPLELNTAFLALEELAKPDET